MEVTYKPETNILICKTATKETFYKIFQIYGQKHVKLLDENFVPPPDTEVFGGNIPRIMGLAEIFKFFSSCGKIYQLRLLMDFSGCNRGKCFVQYATTKASREAICCLHQEIIGDSQQNVVVRKSLNNDQLLVKSIPTWLSPESIREMVSTYMGEGLKQVLIKTSKYYPYTNLCYCQYENHQYAAAAHKRAWPYVAAFGVIMDVHWAVPELIRKARNLFFTSFPPDLTRKQFFDIITRMVEVKTLVHMAIKDGFGFITFTSDVSLARGQTALAGLTIRGYILEFRRESFHNPAPITASFENVDTGPQVFPPMTHLQFRPQQMGYHNVQPYQQQPFAPMPMMPMSGPPSMPPPMPPPMPLPIFHQGGPNPMDGYANWCTCCAPPKQTIL